MTRPTLQPLSIPDLRAAISGRVITPQDDGYDAARTVFVGGVDRRPLVIIQVANEADVQHVVRLARTTGLPLAVRSGGHSNGGLGVVDDGIVLDLRDMRALDLDVAGHTAWVQPGLTAGEYTAAAGEHGLVTGFGDTGSVGIGGLTLGGGVGYLVRKFGLTIDDLLAADIVTADGELVRADPVTNSDLFWAIRGGGGNFGVATRLQLRLHDLPEFTGGMLILPATPETIAGFIAASEAAPEALSTIANVMPCPPMPFVPAERHGQLVILGMLAFVGPDAAGEDAVAPFRALAAPITDMVAAQPYTAMYPPDSDDYHPLSTVRTLFLDTVDLPVAATIVEHLSGTDAMMAVAQLRVLGGAMARVPTDATAFAHRDRRIMVNVAAVFQDPAEHDRHDSWATEFAEALRQGNGGAYVNFLGDDGAARIHEAYPGLTLDRLAAIKRRYDPDNLFRLNQNIPVGDA
jgi:FAD/FMN-containing dehydrogenase